MKYSNELQGIQLWPSMIFFRIWSEFAQNRDPLCSAITQLKNSQTATVESQIALAAKPSVGLYESHFDLFSLPIPEIQNLARFIESSLKQAIQVAHCDTKLIQRLKIRFVDSWYHVTTQGGFLLIFPSHLLHSGLPYRGESERLVIAFNAQALAAH
jgi:Putative 2OG-Fe(II) oxygenase